MPDIAWVLTDSLPSPVTTNRRGRYTYRPHRKCDLRVTYLFHQNWRPEELANVESMSCSRMNSRRRSQSCDDCVDPGINGLQCPLTQCITQGASFDMESTRPSIQRTWTLYLAITPKSTSKSRPLPRRSAAGQTARVAFPTSIVGGLAMQARNVNIIAGHCIVDHGFHGHLVVGPQSRSNESIPRPSNRIHLPLPASDVCRD